MFEPASQPDSVALNGNEFPVDGSIREMTLLIFRDETSQPPILIQPESPAISAQKPRASRWRSDTDLDLGVFSMLGVFRETPLADTLWVVTDYAISQATQKQGTRIKQPAPIRAGSTADFLQADYHFEAEQLRAALESIETAEFACFQQLVDSLEQGKSSQVTSLDTAFEELIDTYKCLQPVELEPVEDPLVREIEETRTQNQQLGEELSLVRNQNCRQNYHEWFKNNLAGYPHAI